LSYARSLSKFLLGCKGLTVTNTLAYYGMELITAVKSFMIQLLEPIL
jgi:hypothetical protein